MDTLTCPLSVDQARDGLKQWLQGLDRPARRFITAASVRTDDAAQPGEPYIRITIDPEARGIQVPVEICGVPVRRESGTPFYTLDRPLILVVDDEARAIASLRRMLQANYKVLVVDPARPIESACFLWDHHPDLRLAILDLRMPNRSGILETKTGIDLLEELRRRRPEARIIIHSGQGSPDDFNEASVRGAAACLRRDLPGAEKARTIERVTRELMLAA